MHQQPEYPDAAAVKEAAGELARMPPLVFAGECRNLQARLAKCATGESFWLQGKPMTPSTPSNSSEIITQTNLATDCTGYRIQSHLCA